MKDEDGGEREMTLEHLCKAVGLWRDDAATFKDAASVVALTDALERLTAPVVYIGAMDIAEPALRAAMCSGAVLLRRKE